MATATADKLLCSKCGANPPAKSDAWCKECRATYQREYHVRREEQIAKQFFARGVQAMRAALARELAKRPGYQIECYSTAQWIMAFDSPAYDEKKAATEAAAG